MDAAVSVMMAVPLPGAATLAFENVAVTPLGSPAALSAMAELKSPEVLLVTVTCTLPPAFSVKLCAFVLRPNEAGAILSGMLIVWVKPLPLAVSDRLELPVTAVAPPLSVKTLEEPAVREAGLNCAVTPAGAPASKRVSGAENEPFVTAHVSDVVVALPGDKTNAAELDARLHVGAATTVKVEATVREKPVFAIAPMVSG